LRKRRGCLRRCPRDFVCLSIWSAFLRDDVSPRFCR
jgi:hypothetical protein